ncbi:O-antigen ligase family protein [Ruminococcus albus]|uniref:O-antigen ligase like membrane protein n=1 Tax=Ruminococcus albus TaxID=1264 RepID=A0A1I1RJE6_RUMAL|nr:O-antigen ligase family protein [Ruminococcus albus]SFD31753.1 O-antigen ligase like membrane protein [Ruminococcus albus]
MFNNRFCLKKFTVNENSKVDINQIALVLFFSGKAIEFILNKFFALLGAAYYSEYCLIGIHCFIVLCILSWFIMKQEKQLLKYKSFILIVVICSLFLLKYLFNSSVGIWLSDNTYGFPAVFGLDGGIFSAGVTAYYIIIIQKNSDTVINGLKISNCFIIVYLLFMAYNRTKLGYFWVTGEGGISVQKAYNMSFGYYSCFISTLNVILWIKERKIYNIIVSVVFSLLSIAYGSRGAIIIYLIFALSLFWLFMKEANVAKKLIIISAIFLFGSFFILFYSEIILFLQRILVYFGVSESRTLESLLAGDISDTDTRDELWAIAKELIKDRFPFGYGVFGERPHIGKYYMWGYSHNIFLEIIIAFGFIGVVLLTFFIIKSFSIINSDADRGWIFIFILFFSQCGILLVSNSFWYHPYFWSAIAVGFIHSDIIGDDKKLKRSKI